MPRTRSTGRAPRSACPSPFSASSLSTPTTAGCSTSPSPSARPGPSRPAPAPRPASRANCCRSSRAPSCASASSWPRRPSASSTPTPTSTAPSSAPITSTWPPRRHMRFQTRCSTWREFSTPGQESSPRFSPPARRARAPPRGGETGLSGASLLPARLNWRPVRLWTRKRAPGGLASHYSGQLGPLFLISFGVGSRAMLRKPRNHRQRAASGAGRWAAMRGVQMSRPAAGGAASWLPEPCRPCACRRRIVLRLDASESGRMKCVGCVSRDVHVSVQVPGWEVGVRGVDETQCRRQRGPEWKKAGAKVKGMSERARILLPGSG